MDIIGLGERRMKVGDRVRDRLFVVGSERHRGIGTILEVHTIERETPGFAFDYAIVEWDRPIPYGNPFALTPNTSEDYCDDLELLENKK